MTNALSGLNGAFYRDDPTAASVAFTQIALTGGGTYQSYQAALGLRYWDPTQTLLIEKQVHGSGGWGTVVPDQIWWVSGKVTFVTPLNPDDKIRATGQRRSETNFLKLFNLYDGQLTWTTSATDISSCESGGWEESISGLKTFQFTADTYFYYNVVGYPYWDVRDLGTLLLAKLYSIVSGNIAWIGFGQLTQNSLNLVSMNKAQSKKITFKGDGELFPEMGA